MIGVEKSTRFLLGNVALFSVNWQSFMQSCQPLWKVPLSVLFIFFEDIGGFERHVKLKFEI